MSFDLASSNIELIKIFWMDEAQSNNWHEGASKTHIFFSWLIVNTQTHLSAQVSEQFKWEIHDEAKKINNNTQNTHIHLFVYALNWTCSDSNFHRTIEYILVHLRIMFNAHDKLLLFHWFVFVVHKFFFCLLFFSIHFDLCFLLLWMRIRFVVAIQNIDENEKNEEKKKQKKNRKSKRKRDEKNTQLACVFDKVC